MQNCYLFSGIGRFLAAVSGATGNSKVLPETTTIANNTRTEGIAAHDCREIVFAVEFDAAPGAGNIIIERAASLADGVWETHATISASGKKFFSWAANERLLGYYRVFNSGTAQPCTVRFNKAII